MYYYNLYEKELMGNKYFQSVDKLFIGQPNLARQHRALGFLVLTNATLRWHEQGSMMK